MTESKEKDWNAKMSFEVSFFIGEKVHAQEGLDRLEKSACHALDVALAESNRTWNMPTTYDSGGGIWCHYWWTDPVHHLT